MKQTLLILAAFAIMPLHASAADLSYGFLEASRNDTELHINYRGPDGERDVRCSVQTLSCREFDPADEPFRIADLLTSLSPTVAPDGGSAVIRLMTAAGPAYALIELADRLDLSLIPLKEPQNVARAVYSRDGDTIAFLGRNLLEVYEDGRVRSHQVAVPSSLTLVSPSGDYVSWYSYTSDEHMIVDLRTGALTSVDSKTPAYFEIAENGEFGVFREVVRGEDVLRVATLPDGDAETAYDDAAAIDDYLVHENVAYFTANEESPLTWSLFAYDPAEDSIDEIDADVAYTDFMRSFGGALFYYKVDGNRGDVYAYDPDSGSSRRIAGQAASDEGLPSVREEREFGDVNGVLWDDGDDEDEEKPLIIWLHGGPQRQTSVGYHSYLSYAVYDEMLSRFVEGGARVAKLDYTGSTGYGERFRTGLTKKVGVADVDDVTEAIDELTDDYETSEVFLVGNSYGGYLALKALVEAPRDIDGVAAIAAVTDWDELIRPNPSSIFAPYFGGVPGADSTNRYYRAAEIMDKLDEIPDDTPIVIAYGEKDTTVPPSQSKIFIAGAENTKNLSIVAFPDEDHIPRKRATLDRLCEEIAGAFGLSDDECSG